MLLLGRIVDYRQEACTKIGGLGASELLMTVYCLHQWLITPNQNDV